MTRTKSFLCAVNSSAISSSGIFLPQKSFSMAYPSSSMCWLNHELPNGTSSDCKWPQNTPEYAIVKSESSSSSSIPSTDRVFPLIPLLVQMITLNNCNRNRYTAYLLFRSPSCRYFTKFHTIDTHFYFFHFILFGQRSRSARRSNESRIEMSITHMPSDASDLVCIQYTTFWL